MTTLQKGDKAPYFEAIDQSGKTIKLTDYKGKKIILFFYPKDNTPTCTIEVCNLRDNYSLLQDAGFELLGVSADSAVKHHNFIKKHHLPFLLLADTEKKMIHDYQVFGEKMMFGKIKEGIFRTTFVINENGILELVLTKVKSKEHAAQILQELEAISAK
jgi:thioredoxin-dependent peroxiredoxin